MMVLVCFFFPTMTHLLKNSAHLSLLPLSVFFFIKTTKSHLKFRGLQNRTKKSEMKWKEKKVQRLGVKQNKCFNCFEWTLMEWSVLLILLSSSSLNVKTVTRTSTVWPLCHWKETFINHFQTAMNKHTLIHSLKHTHRVML